MVRTNQPTPDNIPAAVPIDQSQNPFYIHSSENPAISLVNPVLDGKNYHSWARSMKNAIIMKNKLRFLDGSSLMPVAFDPSYESWMRCNNLVLSWIQNSVNSSIAQSIVYYDVAATAWNDLKSRFSRADRVRVASLQRELYALRQDSTPVLEYFTKVRGLWEELEIFRPIPHCTCLARCQCEAMRNARKFKQEDLILIFLTGLNDHYAAVRSQILIMEPFPDLNTVFSMIVQHESLNSLEVADDSTIGLNLAEARKNNGYKGKNAYNAGNNGYSNKTCTYCGKSGHNIDICYRKNGYPPGFKYKDGSVPKSLMANAAASTSSSTKQDSKPFMGFSEAEFQALRKLLQNSQVGTTSQMNQFASNLMDKASSSSPIEETRGNFYVNYNSLSNSVDMWIIDSGATHHACYSLSMFSKYTKIKPIPVRMPNGSMAQTDIIGEVQVTDLITLQNVLYLPHFKYNLLSVSRVTHSLNCTFAFTDRICAIYDSQQKMIGSVRLHNGLYYLESTGSSIDMVNNTQSGQMPYQKLYNQLPDISMLRFFGCLCYVSTQENHRLKFDNRARKCVFLGYKSVMKGYISLDLHSFEIMVSRHVQFEELIFPYQSQSKSTSTWEFIIPTTTQPLVSTPATEDMPTNHTLPKQTTNTPTNNSPSTTRKSTRPKKVPTHLKDYACNNVTKSILYPITQYTCHDNLSTKQKSYTMSLLTENEPTTYSEACKHEQWIKAMKTELQALQQNNTWTIVYLPPEAKPIGSKWVYKIKRKSDGSIERYKARLVAKGYNQVEGIYYFETFSPVAKMTTIRVVLAIASMQNWFIHQLDVNNAFFHGDLCEDVYMKIPQGLEGFSDDKVCKLTKSLYGLKQASRKWYEKLSYFLTLHKYTQVPSDPTLFVKKTASTFTALLVYVDDIVLTGNNMEEINYVKEELHKTFGIKDLGILKFFLGLEVAHSNKGISLSQRQYCLELLAETGDLGCKPSSVPMDPGHKLHHDDSTPHQDITGYRTLVGKLLYLTNTRPDIAFPVQQLCQFLDCPTVLHYKEAHKVLRYLKGCPGTGLFFPRSSDTHLVGFTYADWGGCIDTRKSITGYCFFLGSSLMLEVQKAANHFKVII
ncbi:hypothetical protein TSUD_153260 [Trifolium subterraneum]|uniref:Reverse transcriptase Ty1/copia-type domain-containing protein n=1 Tax=Trifolium subterraneum TaxID=3900 RepID=A0A2Z6MAL2_TRISU|nr:hypothetical protein TSUD_153260 [Trifolium subterraneum]